MNMNWFYNLRLRWKLQRDISRRGYSEAQVRAQLEHRIADTELYVRPQRDRTDMVVRFVPADGRGRGRPPSARLTMAPRAPTASRDLLRGLCDKVRTPMIRLCDDDATLQIEGGISGEVTRAAVHALADRLPGDPEARAAHLGTVIEGTAEQHSNTLAVAQTVIASALLAAAAKAPTLA